MVRLAGVEPTTFGFGGRLVYKVSDVVRYLRSSECAAIRAELKKKRQEKMKLKVSNSSVAHSPTDRKMVTTHNDKVFMLYFTDKNWSGRPESNRRRSAWEAGKTLIKHAARRAINHHFTPILRPFQRFYVVRNIWGNIGRFRVIVSPFCTLKLSRSCRDPAPKI